MGAVLMVMNAVIARRRNFPVEAAVPVRKLPALTLRALPALMMPLVLLGGIYGGVMTPTEAAAVAALYALVVSVVLYRSVTWRGGYRALAASGRSMASVGMLIAGALVFNYVVTKEDIPKTVSLFMQGFHLTPYMFLLMVNALLLVLGCLLEGGTILLVIVPILLPAAKSLGIDMVHFGLVVTVNLMIGLLTPPYARLDRMNSCPPTRRRHRLFPSYGPTTARVPWSSSARRRKPSRPGCTRWFFSTMTTRRWSSS